jgi:hypothetical protein
VIPLQTRQHNDRAHSWRTPWRRLDVAANDYGRLPLELVIPNADAHVALPPRGKFETMVVDDTIVTAPAVAVGRFLRDAAACMEPLPYIHSIKTVYDDGIYQVIDLETDGHDTGSIWTREVRRFHSYRVTSFQPSPAAFLKHFCLDLIPRPATGKFTRLIAVQRWSLSARAATLFSPTPGPQVERMLQSRIRIALSAWKQQLDSWHTLGGHVSTGSTRASHNETVAQ